MALRSHFRAQLVFALVGMADPIENVRSAGSAIIEGGERYSLLPVIIGSFNTSASLFFSGDVADFRLPFLFRPAALSFREKKKNEHSAFFSSLPSDVVKIAEEAEAPQY